MILPLAIGARTEFSLADQLPTWVIGALLAVNALTGVSQWQLDAHNALLKIQSAALGATSDLRPLNGAIRAALHAHKPPLYVLQQQIAATPRARLVAQLQRMEAENQGKLAVQVSPDATDIWTWSKDGNTIWCTAGHLVVPSETGIVEIRSVAPRSIEQQCMPPGMSWYGYGKQQDMHRSLSLSDSELCTLARSLGATRVYRLVSYTDLGRNRLLSCPAN